MNILNSLEYSLDNLWQNVLKPPRTPICNDILGLKYSYTLNDNIYRRQDGKFKTFDNFEIRYTVYLKLNKNKTITPRKSRPFNKNFLTEIKNNVNFLYNETDSIEGIIIYL